MDHTPRREEDVPRRETEETPAWTREQAAGLERDPDAVAPVIYPPEHDTFDGLHVWDTWPLRARDGSLAEVGGYRVLIALTTPDDLLPGKRHDVARHHYFYAADGEHWTHGGPVFGEPDDSEPNDPQRPESVDDEGASTAVPYGSRQWAGSAMYDAEADELYCYYTAAGRRGSDELSYEQRIAGASGGSIAATDDGVEITGPWDHEVLLEPDGDHYEREDQSRGMTYTFRDPWFFEDPATGETYLLFEANTPVPEGSDACGGDPVQQEFNGSVGVAHSPTGDPMDWELRPPLLEAVCVNQELERPHVVVRDGRYYLFVSSHLHTFAPGLEGYDALYGFVADSLGGDYEPLNGHGLVATNPANAPFQAYSWVVYPHADELLAVSFFNYYDYAGENLDGVAHLPEEEQLRRFGGTLAPTLRLDVADAETRIAGTLRHGHLPLPDEELEPVERRLGAASATGAYRR
ncbi:glycoside hydrolase family 68 protein [Haloparvum sedimenti]|uniref:glycoside hydrolase family 68 protein n=1 Tax=Haloparvum sedimenti TaxID=1678448 RepID=UPI00071E870B|nr:glycoside hydrolase family 68 protein [Haloparvum sedimenti]